MPTVTPPNAGFPKETLQFEAVDGPILDFSGIRPISGSWSSSGNQGREGEQTSLRDVVVHAASSRCANHASAASSPTANNQPARAELAAHATTIAAAITVAVARTRVMINSPKGLCRHLTRTIVRLCTFITRRNELSTFKFLRFRILR